ncbi:hypothetical protein TR13x_05050 [Caloranaerobacter sp. TR13]|uniref:S-layer homology domain-containing protein n=1 Tax=Caloranaerobacter sp. TR13 TaxID=1302151 RepID=UPI0006D483AE|nr:S-layer homology domain-containing protein [Caloranaerobacter sp. TR13]KPU27440.1 hypothetical protein TR13x_05050 [Caloranaerobacter sp. TR13]
MKKLMILLLIIFIPSFAYSSINEGLLLETSSTNLSVNNTFKVNVKLSDISNVYALHIKINFNPTYISSNNTEIILPKELKNRQYFAARNYVDNNNGVAELMFTLLGNEKSLSSDLTIGSLNFKCIKKGNTDISIEYSYLLDKNGLSIKHDTNNITMKINEKTKYNLQKNNYQEVHIIGKTEKTINIGNNLILFVPSKAFPDNTKLSIKVITSNSKNNYNIYDITSDKKINGNVKLSFDITNFNQQPIGIYYYNEDREKWIYLGDKIENNFITTWVNHFTKFTVLKNNNYKEYKDINDNWAKDYVKYLTSMGIVNGIEDAYFQPNRYITRSEISKLLNLALGLKNYKQTANFKDLDSIPNWAYTHVMSLTEKGIIKGYDDNTFRPNINLTRTELAVMLDRILAEYTSNKDYEIFADDIDIPDWGRDSIYKMKALGILEGYEDNTFKPNNYVTRAEVCKVIYQMLKVLKII